MKTPRDTDPPHDESPIEAHLKSCPDCAKRAARLDRMIASLKDHKEVFCPEVWQLHDYATCGDDPGGEIAEHVERCSLCAEKVAEFRSPAKQTPSLPPDFMQAVKKEYPPPPPSESLLTRVRELFASFRMPAFAIATAAAAILVLVMVFPRGAEKPVLGLSSVSWDGEMKIMGPEPSPEAVTKPRVAMVILFKGFATMWPQERIDALYRSLGPNQQMLDKFEFVSPEEVKDSIGKEKVATEAKPLAERLHKDLNVGRLILLTLRPDGEKVTVDAKMIDASSGETLGKKTEPGVPGAKLMVRLKAAAGELLSP